MTEALSERDRLKRAAALRAIEYVEDGMVVGLGTGSTATFVVAGLGARVADGLKIVGIPTSERTATQARGLGIPLATFAEHQRIDLTIDGADEVDPALRAIKGGGGALLREKVVAAASDRVCIAVDSSKPVIRLGRFPLPLEVLPFAGAWVARALAELGGTATRRLGADGSPFHTDQGNAIFDAAFGPIEDVRGLALRLSQVAGIVEHGLFLDEIDMVFIGRPGGVEVRRRDAAS